MCGCAARLICFACLHWVCTNRMFAQITNYNGISYSKAFRYYWYSACLQTVWWAKQMHRKYVMWNVMLTSQWRATRHRHRLPANPLRYTKTSRRAPFWNIRMCYSCITTLHVVVVKLIWGLFCIYCKMVRDWYEIVWYLYVNRTLQQYTQTHLQYTTSKYLPKQLVIGSVWRYTICL